MKNGPDSKWHWEFNKHWEQFYKGEGEEWWLRFVPRKVRDRIDYQVKMQVRKMEKDLRSKEDELERKLAKMRNADREHQDERERHLEQIRKLKNRIKDSEL